MKKIFGDSPESIEARAMHRDLEIEVGLVKDYYDFLKEGSLGRVDTL